MAKSKSIKEKGKLSFTRYFQKFSEGDPIVLTMNLSFKNDFPLRMQGRTGVVIGTRGAAYVVKVNEGNMARQYIVKAINLKKIAELKK